MHFVMMEHIFYTVVSPSWISSV